VIALVALASISTFVSGVAVWAHQVVFSTDKWVETVGPLAEDEAVTDALAAFLVEELMTVIDAQGLAENALPDEADFLAAPLTSAFEGFVTDQVEKMLESEQFQTFWVEANRVAHEQAIRLLEGKPGVVTVTEGEVTLNLLPLMTRILVELDDFGVLPSRFSVPDITRDTPVTEANAMMAEALGVDLDPDFGQIVVYQSDQLAAIQDAVATFDDLVEGVVVLTIVLYAAAVIISVNRRRTVLQLGLSLVGAIIVAAAIINAAMNHVLNLVSDETDRSAASAAVRIVLQSLREIERAVTLVALLAAAIAFLSGDSTWAVRIRRFFRQAIRRGPLDDGEPELVAVSWFDQHRDALRIGGLGIALLVLLVVDLTFGSLLAVAVALGVYEGLLAWLPSHLEFNEDADPTPAAGAATEQPAGS
jgi:hypothetical protein